NGYCYNNELVNKRSSPALCNSIPNQQEQILTYTYGNFNLLANYTNTTITACQNDILHGTFDMGSNPNAVLFQALNSNGQLTLGMINVHRGYKKDSYSNPVLLPIHLTKALGKIGKRAVNHEVMTVLVIALWDEEDSVRIDA
ncbi:unnamed protein product, partial [Didymodactylos carnosus]